MLNRHLGNNSKFGMEVLGWRFGNYQHMGGNLKPSDWIASPRDICR